MRNRNKSSFLRVIAMSSVFVSWQSYPYDQEEGFEYEFQEHIREKKRPGRLNELHRITGTVEYDKEREGTQKVRRDAVKQTAFSWGVQEGLYWRYSRIDDMLERQSQELHTVFSFNKFLIDGKMLLPTILEANRIFEQRDENTVRTVNVSYTLDRKAKLVPQPPTWRDYLIRRIDKPTKPHDVMFPRTHEEKMIWEESLDRGWNQGVEQANEIFEIDLRELQKEIEGMYRFRKLLAMGVVTMPKVASAKDSVIKFSNGKTINLNDVVYSIQTESEFTETDEWKPFFKAELSHGK